MRGRTVVANGELIKRRLLLMNPRLTQAELAAKSGWSTRVISKLIGGELVQEEVVEDVAEVLGTTYEALTAGCNPDRNIVPVPPEAHEQINAAIQASGLPEKLRRILGSEKIHIIVFSSSTLGILLACMGLFPIYALPYYVGGAIISCLALGIAHIKGHGYSLPIAGLLSCTVAIASWPNVFGLFHSTKGYEFRPGVRIEWVPKSNPHYYASISTRVEGTFYVNEPVAIRYELESGEQFTDTIMNLGFGPALLPNVPVGSKCRIRLEVGLKEVDSADVVVKSRSEGETICVLRSPKHTPPNTSFFFVDVWGKAFNELPRPERELPLFLDGKMIGKYSGAWEYFETTSGVHSVSVLHNGKHYRVDCMFVPVSQSTGVGMRDNYVKITIPDDPP